MNIYDLLRLRGQLPAILGGGQPPGVPAIRPGMLIDQRATGVGNAALGDGIPPAPNVGPMNPSALAPFLNKGPMASRPPMPPPTGGFLGGVDRLLGGAGLQGLNPENRADARRQGLLAAGAQMLLASGRRPGRGAGLGEVLGQGILAGQAGYGQGIQQGQAAQAAQQQQAIWSQLEPQPNEQPADTQARLQKMLHAAIGMGEQGRAFVGPISQALVDVGATIRAQGRDKESRTVLTPWEKEGFATKEEYLKYRREWMNAGRAPGSAGGRAGGGAAARNPYLAYLGQQVDDLRAASFTAEAQGDTDQAQSLREQMNGVIALRDQLAKALPGAPKAPPIPKTSVGPLPFGYDPRNPFAR